jgi:hypothetical protein
VIGPRWLQRILYRKRWHHLDILMDAEVEAINLVTTWRVHAENATGVRLWHCNHAAALAEQVAEDTRQVWLAIYDGRTVAAADATLRMKRHSEELSLTVHELIEVPV